MPVTAGAPECIISKAPCSVYLKESSGEAQLNQYLERARLGREICHLPGLVDKHEPCVEAVFAKVHVKDALRKLCSLWDVSLPRELSVYKPLI